MRTNQLISLSKRAYTPGPVNLQGKFGMLPKQPHLTAHQYDPRKVPNLFTNALKVADEEVELDEYLDQMKAMMSQPSLQGSSENTTI